MDDGPQNTTWKQIAAEEMAVVVDSAVLEVSSGFFIVLLQF